MSSAKASLDDRSRRVAESLQVGNPGNNARSLPAQIDSGVECQIELGIDEIRPYEDNPRRSANAKFDDIKESIRTSGLRSPLTVTQRPGESHYIVEAGGNTRLLALRQLWAETKEPRFRKLVVLFRPWRSESHVLTAHLIENEQRGDMSFWDRATGIAALKTRLEAEQGRALTLRPLEDALHELGLATNTATLALYLFATERLRTLGEAVADLSGLDVKTLQPRLNALRRYAHARGGIDEAALYAEVFDPVFRAPAGSFSVAATVEACEIAVARRLGEPVDTLRAVMRSAPREPAQSAKRQPANPPAADTLAGADALSSSVRAYAEKAGLGAALEPAPASSSGFRLRRLPDVHGQDPARRRAWSALALVAGDVPKEAASALPSAPELVRWLTDPANETADAFWSVLSCLRQSRAAQPAVSPREAS